MKVSLMRPSTAEAKVTSSDNNKIAIIQPRRWSKKQQTLTVIPLESHNEAGKLLDSITINVNQRTGKMSLERSSVEELPIEADNTQPSKNGDVK